MAVRVVLGVGRWRRAIWGKVEAGDMGEGGGGRYGDMSSLQGNRREGMARGRFARESYGE